MIFWVKSKTLLLSSPRVNDLYAFLEKDLVMIKVQGEIND
jgi:hypothetical protein